MTTVNVRIERLGSSDRLYLQNGMWGPATSILHAFGRACQDGRIPSSKWNVAEISEVTTGAVVRQALDAIIGRLRGEALPCVVPWSLAAVPGSG